MMGTFNVPWFLVVNAGKAATQMLLKEPRRGERSRDAEEEHGGTLTVHRIVRPSKGPAAPPASLRSISSTTYAPRSSRRASATSARGFVKGRRRSGHGDGYQRIRAGGAVRPGFLRAQGLPADNPARGGEVASLKPAKFPAIRTQRDPVSYEKLAGSEAAARVGSDRKRDIDDGQVVQVLRRRGVQAGEHRPRDDVERSLAIRTGGRKGAASGTSCATRWRDRTSRGGPVRNLLGDCWPATIRAPRGRLNWRAGFAHAHVERFERVRRRRRRRFRHAVGRVGGGIVPRGE